MKARRDQSGLQGSGRAIGARGSVRGGRILIHLALIALIAASVATIAVRKLRSEHSPELPVPPGPMTSPSQPDILAQLIARLGEEESDLRTLLESDSSDSERLLALQAHGSNLSTAESLLAAVQSAPRSDLAAAALTQIVVRFPDTDVARQAAERLVAGHLGDEALESNLGFLENSGAEQARKVLSAAFQNSPVPRIRARAGYSLASLWSVRAERQSWRDPASARAAAEKAAALFREVVDHHGEFRGGRGRLGDLAQARLDEMESLSVGRVAPEIEGEDIDGRSMSLSDYRGKVVVIAFWGYWCSLCQSMFPHERELVRKMEGRPFAFLGVNDDQDGRTPRSLAQSGEVTWRSWKDPGELEGGPIARRWNVRELPDFYILDDEGVIQHHVGPHADDHGRLYFLDDQGKVRHRWRDRTEEIQEVVEALVREVEQKRPDHHQARN